MLMRSLLALSFVALLAPLHASSSSVEDSELNALSARLRARNLQVDRLQRVSPHLVEVTIKGETVYATPDGNIMLFGQAISFDQNERPTNLTTAALWNKVLELVNNGSTIKYKADNEKATLVVFTDYTCGYCGKFHASVPELNKQGISIAYIAFPRSGPNSPSYETMRSVWCADNPQEALTNAFNGAQIAAQRCARADAVDQGWELSQKLGMQGTPSMMLPGGHVVTGYHSVEDIMKLLDVAS